MTEKQRGKPEWSLSRCSVCSDPSKCRWVIKATGKVHCRIIIWQRHSFERAVGGESLLKLELKQKKKSEYGKDVVSVRDGDQLKESQHIINAYGSYFIEERF